MSLTLSPRRIRRRQPEMATPKDPQLAEAANLVRYGWLRFGMHDSGRYCATGAILEAQGNLVRNRGGLGIAWEFLMMDLNPSICRVANAIQLDDRKAARRLLGVDGVVCRFIVRLIFISPALKVMLWNDYFARSGDEVAEVMERAAYRV